MPQCTQAKLYCDSLCKHPRKKLGDGFHEGDSPLNMLRKMGPKEYIESGACPPCAEWFMSVLAEKQEEIWESVPTDFDLPRIDPSYTNKAYSMVFDEASFLPVQLNSICGLMV